MNPSSTPAAPARLARLASRHPLRALTALTALALGLQLAACASLPAPSAPSAPAAGAPAFAKGADISWVTEMEAAQYVFRDRNGAPRDLFAILKDQGMDAVRLRIWVDPQDGWNGIADTIAKARRAQAAGMRIMLDFHYSDSWADPQQQTKPAASAHLDAAGLADALAAHTRASLLALRAAGIAPEWVQVGNETRDGLLWPEGRASTNMANYALFVKRGYGAVKDVFPQAQVIVHVDNCHDNATFRWNFDGLAKHGAPFDVIGISSYPTTAKGHTWRSAVAACTASMDDLVARYGKPVMLTEVGAPWDDPEAGAIVSSLIARARAVRNGPALGVFYWEPEAYGWKNYGMGAFDQRGKPGPGMDAFLER
ncbi:arabinogalactan endo-1,4-beta-galactosidase [Massilia forsythiae]|uniref:Arabinogalactan endo-beta-1,4-galactanase n=1 Tax=Massilia forsythiae TaxID=2728020 RepID=A0A7Z2VYX8_9BURK|nr:glycosyl hydrolase 53 family protein [Massilia forsythiae]QJE01851.1 arabinogalactan endo-1,4-beta-galactosidase [Massilia forsythiae]